MKTKKTILLLLLLFTIVTIADDTSVRFDWRTGAVFPLNNENIKMVKETVNYDYRTSEFHTVYWMKNMTNKKQSISIGFPIDPDPKKYPDDYTYDTGYVFNEFQFMKKIEKDFNFRTWINENEIERKIMKVEPSKTSGFKYAFVANLEFQSDEELIIENKYIQKVGLHSNTIGLHEAFLGYTLTTGANWKDSIDHAYFEFILPSTYNINSEKYEFTGNFLEDRVFYINHHKEILNKPIPTRIVEKDSLCTLIWDYYDIEPDFNILFKHKSWAELYGGWFHSFNIHTLHISDMIINSSPNIDNFNERIDNFRNFIESKVNSYNTDIDYLNDIDFIKKFVKYYFDQVKINNSTLKKKPQYYQARKSFIINFIYASNGYDFKNEQWKKLFECFKWYKPSTTAPVLSDEEKKMIDEIEAL